MKIARGTPERARRKRRADASSFLSELLRKVERTCVSIAAGRGLEIFRFARSFGDDWGEDMTSRAAEGNNLEPLQWAR